MLVNKHTKQTPLIESTTEQLNKVCHFISTHILVYFSFCFFVFCFFINVLLMRKKLISTDFNPFWPELWKLVHPYMFYNKPKWRLWLVDFKIAIKLFFFSNFRNRIVLKILHLLDGSAKCLFKLSLFHLKSEKLLPLLRNLDFKYFQFVAIWQQGVRNGLTLIIR